MKQEDFLKGAIKEYGQKKAPADLIGNVMKGIEKENVKAGYRPLMAPWVLKLLAGVLAIVLLILIFSLDDSAGEAILKFPEWNISFPELSINFSSLVLPSLVAVFLLVLVDALSHWNKRVL